MKRFLSSLLSMAFALTLTASPLAQTFQKAKEQFRLADYRGALSTLDRLDVQSQAAEFAGQRAALLPALAFYRGASLAALGRAGAVEQFETYLVYRPEASLDPGLYSKKIRQAFDRAKALVAARSPRGTREAEDSGIVAAYAEFPSPPSGGEEGSLGEDWADGPVGALLTREERQKFEGLFDTVARSQFVEDFWLRRDPKPETPENEFRLEFEKRVAFADSRFVQDEKRGSLTDRGTVFLLLGPPTWIGRRPITAGDEYAPGHAGLSQYNRHDITIAKNFSGGSTGAKAAAMDRVQSPTGKITEAAPNWLEVWHYRRDRLPSGVPYQVVDVEFVTRQGYGTNVLQRDPPVLTTLHAARSKPEAVSQPTSR